MRIQKSTMWIVGVTATTFLAAAAHASTIGVNLTGYNPVTLGDADTAGVVAQDHWNNLDEQGASDPAATDPNFHPISLVQDDDGTASTSSFSNSGATLAWDGFSARDTTGTSGDDQANDELMDGFHEAESANATQLRVRNLPSSYTSVGYHVTVYLDHSDDRRAAEWTVTEDPDGSAATQSHWARAMSGADFSSGGNGFVESTATTLAAAPNANYVRFESLTDPNFDLGPTDSDQSIGSFGRFVGITGFQIVPVPEPASLALVVIGGLCLIPRRHRR